MQTISKCYASKDSRGRLKNDLFDVMDALDLMGKNLITIDIIRSKSAGTISFNVLLIYYLAIV